MAKKLENTTTVEVVAEEVPKAVAPVEAVVKNTPVPDRLHVLKAAPSIEPKGAQRRIVLNILKEATQPLSIKQIAKRAAIAGLAAVGGVEPSCQYHLHHLVKLGIAEVVNPTVASVDPTIAETEVREAAEL
jgi:hypothetical protein